MNIEFAVSGKTHTGARRIVDIPNDLEFVVDGLGFYQFRGSVSKTSNKKIRFENCLHPGVINMAWRRCSNHKRFTELWWDEDEMSSCSPLSLESAAIWIRQQGFVLVQSDLPARGATKRLQFRKNILQDNLKLQVRLEMIWIIGHWRCLELKEQQTILDARIDSVEKDCLLVTFMTDNIHCRGLVPSSKIPADVRKRVQPHQSIKVRVDAPWHPLTHCPWLVMVG